MNARRSRSGSRKRRFLAGFEWFFLLLGLVLLDYFVWVHTSSALYQAYQDWAFDQKLRGLTPSVQGFVRDEVARLTGGTPSKAPMPAVPEQPFPRMPRETAPAPASVIGRLQIPRLNVTAMVREGADEGTLRNAVGHIPGTALPGRIGNVALAGHRDTFFRGLRNIRKNDVIDLQTEGGTYRYIVESTKIVSPRDVSVLKASASDSLTLVTCYPFYYVGSAPKRFIVRAEQVAEVDSRPPAQRGS